MAGSGSDAVDGFVLGQVDGVGVVKPLRLDRGLDRHAVEGAFEADVLLPEGPDLVLVADKLGGEAGLDELREFLKHERLDLL